MTAVRTHTDQGEITHEEIAWLATFGYTVERIAQRLRMTVDGVERHVNGERGGDPIRVYREPVFDVPETPNLARQRQTALTRRTASA